MYMKFKNRQIYCAVIEIGPVVVCGRWGLTEKANEETFWDDGYVLYVDRGGGCSDIHIYQKL